jgi:hypothetical protein
MGIRNRKRVRPSLLESRRATDDNFFREKKSGKQTEWKILLKAKPLKGETAIVFARNQKEDFALSFFYFSTREKSLAKSKTPCLSGLRLNA